MEGQKKGNPSAIITRPGELEILGITPPPDMIIPKRRQGADFEEWLEKQSGEYNIVRDEKTGTVTLTRKKGNS